MAAAWFPAPFEVLPVTTTRYICDNGHAFYIPIETKAAEAP
jgi:hypothetical protein